ncbi:MAG: hypothetical protein PHP53_07330 [Prolixibacteraceae bacterium]|nr:hypothetical protein [Prolixibacteraceae bacterium]
MNEGYIKLHRQLIESQVFANQTALKIWVWCLLKASRKERFFPLKIGKGSTTIKILPGQFIFGRFKAEEELNIDGSTIYRWLQKFKSEEFSMITVEANNQYSIISICNWTSYQAEKSDSEQPMINQRTRLEPDMNTDNTVNTVKKKERVKFTPPSLLEIETYFSEKIKEKGLSMDPKIEAEKFDAHYGSINWKVGSNKMTDWRKSISGWVTRNNKEQSKQKQEIKLNINPTWQ